jgi:hypothetical protein
MPTPSLPPSRRRSRIEPMATEPPEADLLRQLEEQLLRPEVRSSAEQVGRLLADDFIEFGSSGHAYDKQQIIEALRKETPDPTIRLSLTEFVARRLAREVILVTYRTIQRGGPEVPDRSRLRSSIWKMVEGRWQMVFHQGTPSPLPD